MKRKAQVPERLVRVMNGKPEIDHENRTIRAQIVTRTLARDGGIVVPDGIITRFYEDNPVVMARHGFSDSSESPVIGRSLGLVKTDYGMISTTQFAEDTRLAQEYMYLYGINPKEEVYMRAWSFGWSTLEFDHWTIDDARKWLGDDWEEDVVDMWTKRFDEVWVSLKSEMHEYSAVPVGSDRDSLSRALSDGVKTAGDIILVMDLREARSELARINKEKAINAVINEVRSLTRQIQALSRDGVAAAARGDSATILQEVRALVKLAKEKQA